VKILSACGADGDNGLILPGFGEAWSPDQCRGLAEIGVIVDLLDEKIGNVGARDRAVAPVCRLSSILYRPVQGPLVRMPGLESGVMSYERRAGDERNELRGALGERRRRAKLFIGQTMNGDSRGRDGPAWVEIRVPRRRRPPFRQVAPHSPPRRSCGPRGPSSPVVSV